jgi:hypothetical protein
VPARADEPATGQAEKDKNIQQLIEQLAGSKSDRQRKNGVFKAADELLKLGTDAFPQLIEHFDDKRYSFDEDSMAADDVYQYDVGELCYRLVVKQVKVYRPWKQADPRGTPGYSGSIIQPDKDDAKAWWEKNKKTALWELQADSVRRVIEKNKNPRWFKFDSEQRHKLADEAIRANEELLKQLTETKTPFPTGPVRPYHGK